VSVLITGFYTSEGQKSVPDSQKGFVFVALRAIAYRVYWSVGFNKLPFGGCKTDEQCEQRQTVAIWSFHCAFAVAGVVKALEPGVFFSFLLSNWLAFGFRLFILSTVGENNKFVAKIKTYARMGKPNAGVGGHLDVVKLRAYYTQVEGMVSELFVVAVLIIYPLYELIDQASIGQKWFIPTLHQMLFREGVLPVLGLFVSEYLQDLLAEKIAIRFRGPESGKLLQNPSFRYFARAGYTYSVFLLLGSEIAVARVPIYDSRKEGDKAF